MLPPLSTHLDSVFSELVHLSPTLYRLLVRVYGADLPLHVGHMCQTQGPRAKCGSRSTSMWPPRLWTVNGFIALLSHANENINSYDRLGYVV